MYMIKFQLQEDKFDQILFQKSKGVAIQKKIILDLNNKTWYLERAVVI